MKYQTILAAVIFVVAAAPPEANRPASGKGATPSEAEIVVTADPLQRSNPNKRVCRRTVATGSIMPKTTCRTVAQWEAEREKSIGLKEQIASDRKRASHTQALREAAQ